MPSFDTMRVPQGHCWRQCILEYGLKNIRSIPLGANCKTSILPIYTVRELQSTQQSTEFCSYSTLDLSCALTIKILHRSHRHRLTAIKGKSLTSFVCGVCGTQHQPGRRLGEWEVRSYVCSVCDYWIHPECALLPNAIVIDKHHPHPLLLTYFDPIELFIRCKICNVLDFSDDLWMYACFGCSDYLVHIKCAVYSDPGQISFKPVLIRDAQVPGLLRLPMPNENTSVVSCILMKSTDVTNVGGASASIDDHQKMISDGGKLFDKTIHEHPLILHDHPAVASNVAGRVCNACIQLISSSDPFYSCSLNNNNNSTSNELTGPCRDFFLHRCCAHLSDTLKITQPGLIGTFKLVSKAHTPFNMFLCLRCERRCNGFAYFDIDLGETSGIYMDVVCAYTLTSIMHNAHAKSHILRPENYYSGYSRMTCNCCSNKSREMFGYECNNCRDFFLHAECALLPDTVTHKFDKHPLKLITTGTLIDDHVRLVASEEDEGESIIMFCEICEKDIDERCWYYGCMECDQCFHIGCIPTLDHLSKIKFGFTVRVSCHDCPVAAVRALSVDGYPCGHCRKIIRESDEIAFECSECYFMIHQDCAEELLVSN
ncbi:hypothetical protein CASFOL_035854 [Castilleja foliolosa]|uniref:Phorbol-ester/DAG-type domain-containing protein n=1 Tax=Castilleja foliolosa TaxID=1961234 RepID=A0ABD3BW76_9LAMI